MRGGYSMEKDKVYSTLPLRPCAHPGCAALVRGSAYCDKHRAESRAVRRNLQGERGISAAWHYLYESRRWRTIRAAQLMAEPFCRECARVGERVRATDVDHIKPHRGNKKLFYDTANLQSLCHACHSRKTMAERGRGSPPVENV